MYQRRNYLGRRILRLEPAHYAIETRNGTHEKRRRRRPRGCIYCCISTCRSDRTTAIFLSSAVAAGGRAKHQQQHQHQDLHQQPRRRHRHQHLTFFRTSSGTARRSKCFVARRASVILSNASASPSTTTGIAGEAGVGDGVGVAHRGDRGSEPPGAAGTAAVLLLVVLGEARAAAAVASAATAAAAAASGGDGGGGGGVNELEKHEEANTNTHALKKCIPLSSPSRNRWCK